MENLVSLEDGEDLDSVDHKAMQKRVLDEIAGDIVEEAGNTTVSRKVRRIKQEGKLNWNIAVWLWFCIIWTWHAWHSSRQIC